MPDQRRRHSWLFSGIAGASFVAVTQLVTRESLGTWQTIALDCFAFAIPAAMIFVVWPEDCPVRLPKTIGKLVELVGALAGFAFTIGIAALILSLNITAGIIFAAMTIFSLLVMDYVFKRRKGDSDNAKRVE